MPFYEVTIQDLHGPDGLAIISMPYEAPSPEQAVRDGIAYAAACRKAHPDDAGRVTVVPLSIGRFNPTTGLIETTYGDCIYDSADADASITIPELPAFDPDAWPGVRFGPSGVAEIATTRPHTDAVALGLAHGQRPDEAPALVGAHAVVDIFEEFEGQRHGEKARERFTRRGQD